MPVPLFLLKCVGRAGLNLVGVGLLGDVLIDVLPELAQEVWRHWQKETTPQQRREELAHLAAASQEEYQTAVRQAVSEVAGRQSVESQEHLTEYLLQLQASVRRTFRRVEDCQGITAPPSWPMNSAGDVLCVLPTGRSRFSPGDQPLLGVDWKLVEPLGAGGFGEVWKAEHTHLASIETVALKFCLDSQAAGLLKHEAQLLDRVMRHGRHEGIVQLRHTYLSADPPCLEYELVEGGDLSAWMRNRFHSGGLTSAQAALMIHRLAEITAFAHHNNPPIVHRDLKPANILLALQTGPSNSANLTNRLGLSLKIADFGIGSAAVQSAAAKTREQMTAGQMMTNAVRGAHTPLYASPQQIRGEDADPRDDVFALGVIWHQLLMSDLTAAAPRGRRWAEKLSALGLNSSQIDVLASCFEAARADRPADAGVLARQIQTAFGGLLDEGEIHSPSSTLAPAPITSPAPSIRVNEVIEKDLIYNSIGIKLRRISPGEFLMGTAEEEYAAEHPSRQVEVTRPFWICVYPITERDYQQLMGTLPKLAALDARCPIRQVSWLDAIAFCNRLSLRENRTCFYHIRGERIRTQPSNGYRLTTEAEWEYVCRAGKTTQYSFGDDSSLLSQYAWFEENAPASPQSVGQQQPNAWGLYDLHGNVWEWCGDWFHESYYRNAPARDPQGPSTGHLRAVRGGSSPTPALGLRCAARDGADPQGRFDDIGFRVVLMETMDDQVYVGDDERKSP